MSDLPPANWYPDPEVPGQQRYWDGTQWTEHRAPGAGAGPAQSDPAQPTEPSWSSSDTVSGPAGAPAGAPSQPWGQQGQQPGYGQAYAPAGQGGGNNGMAITSMIVGIISFFLAFIVIGAIGGVAAVVLGFVALKRIKEQPQSGRGMAITGIITGGLAIVIGVVMVFVFFVIGQAVEQGSTGFTDFFECLEEEARTGQDLADC